jgi:hypothetical protein
MDALYLDEKLLPALGRRRYLRRHPLRWLQSRLRAGIETLFVFVQLMRLVPDKRLRSEYRLRLMRVLVRRPRITLLRLYCVKCALHFHADQLVKEMTAQQAALVALEGDDRVSRAEMTAPAAV